MKEHARRLDMPIHVKHSWFKIGNSKIGIQRSANPVGESIVRDAYAFERCNQLAAIKVAEPLYVYAILDPASSPTT